jgi:ribonuclease HI
LVLGLVGKLPEKELSTWLLTLYHIWLARNEARDLQMIEHPDQTARRVVFLSEEWQSIKTPNPGRVKTTEQWMPPPRGWVKANYDGACLVKDGVGGGGAVLRDHHGEFQIGACRFLPTISDPEREELQACRVAAELAKDTGARRLILESDCMGVVTKLGSGVVDRSVHGPLVEDIKVLLHDFDEVKVQYVRRSANGVAHRLAQEGCRNKTCNTWIGVPLDWIVNLLDSECGVI